MPSNSSRQHATAVLLDDEQDLLRSPTCPLCHTSATLAQSALKAGGDWRCVRCGQRWDAARLATVAAYAAWTIDHDRVGSHNPALYANAPTGWLGGRP
jgi:ribosomal protein L37AE/L43A